MNRVLAILVLVCAVLGAPTAAQESSRRTTPSAPALNINTATSSQLEELPGIGKATADRIVEYRQKNGGFKKVEDLMNIRGIGEKSFLKLKPLVTVATPKETAAP